MTAADVLWGCICAGAFAAQCGALWGLLRWLDGRVD